MELDHAARFDVDQMVVVRVARRLVARPPALEIVALDDARFLEQADRPVDGRDRDARVERGGAAMDLLDVGMVDRRRQDARDRPALLGDAQPLGRAQRLDIDRAAHRIRRPAAAATLESHGRGRKRRGRQRTARRRCASCRGRS